MFNISKIKYSIMHNIAVNLLAKKVQYQDKEKLLKQVKYHDMDKVLNYLIGSVKNAHNLHVLNSSHHLESNNEKTELDLCEMVLDWESARYTKKDKPLNAHQTLEKYYSKYKKEILPILDELKLEDTKYIDKEVLNYLNNLDLSIEMILDIVIDYINYLKNNNIKLYFSLDEIVLKIYQSLSVEEQLYFKNHINIDNLLKRKKKIRIGLFTHKNPDYDALCSTLTIANYISKLTNNEDIEVVPVIEPVYILKNLKNKLKIYSLQELNDKNIDYAILCDVNEKDRIYGLDLLESVSIDKRYIIDHHDKNREEVECYSSNKIILPQYSSTSEIIGDLFKKNKIILSYEDACNLYFGIASDSFEFQRNLSNNLIEVVKYLNLSNTVKREILYTMNDMTELQKELKFKIKEYYNDGNFKILTLLLPNDYGDIMQYLNHREFNNLTLPNNDILATFFIIGSDKNYTVKMKKDKNCCIDLLSFAINNNGGGHQCCCVARFNNICFENVIKKIFNEINYFKKSLRKKKNSL